MSKTEIFVSPRDGKQYKKVFGKYGEIQSISEYNPKKSYVQLLSELKPATRIKQYIDKYHKDNFLLKSALVQAPLELLIASGLGRQKQKYIKKKY